MTESSDADVAPSTATAPAQPDDGAPPAIDDPDEARASLLTEKAGLLEQNAALQRKLGILQQQHAALNATAHAMARPAPVAPNPAWSQQSNAENGIVYYWNAQTGQSTYTQPPDFRPTLSPRAAPVGEKGPPGANLFVVRKLRRGELDDFNDEDLRQEFSKYGTVTRAALSFDRETGISKGFGFVSFSAPAEADAAMAVVNGTWVGGREMVVEKTKGE